MHTLSLNELPAITGGRWLVEPCNTAPVAGLTSDSREVTPNLAFAAIRGEHTDGHNYIAQSIASGARLVLVERDLSPDSATRSCAILRVDRTIKALGALATEHRNRLSIPVIAVVGANGKTSTKAAIACAIGSFAIVRSAPKSFNNDLGVPITLLNTAPDHRAVVCEIGTNDIGETAPLAAVVQPDILVITGAGREHLEGLGSAQGSADEIACCLQHMRPNSLIITNADEPLTRHFASPRSRTISVGFEHDADVRVSIDGQSLHGLTATLESTSRLITAMTFRLQTIAAHTARSAAMAAVVSLHTARDRGKLADTVIPQMTRALASRPPEPMRLEVSTRQIELGTVTLINDAYNANPDSMHAAIGTLARVAPRNARLVVVLGDMRETGTHARSVHEELASHIVSLHGQSGCDVVVVLVGTSVHWTASALRAHPEITTTAFTNQTSCTEETASRIVGLLKPNDIVLLKASRSVGLERVAEHLMRSEPAASR